RSRHFTKCLKQFIRIVGKRFQLLARNRNGRKVLVRLDRDRRRVGPDLQFFVDLNLQGGNQCGYAARSEIEQFAQVGKAVGRDGKCIIARLDLRESVFARVVGLNVVTTTLSIIERNFRTDDKSAGLVDNSAVQFVRTLLSLSGSPSDVTK